MELFATLFSSWLRGDVEVVGDDASNGPFILYIDNHFKTCS